MLSDEDSEEEEEEIPIETQVEELDQYWLYIKNFVIFKQNQLFFFLKEKISSYFFKFS